MSYLGHYSDAWSERDSHCLQMTLFHRVELSQTDVVRQKCLEDRDRGKEKEREKKGVLVQCIIVYMNSVCDIL